MTSATRTDPLFDISGLTLRFGGLVSLSDVSLTMSRDEILAVIGPNGAGKTSLFNCLTGVYRPREGSVRYWPSGDGQPLSLLGKPTHVVNRLGIARTFQNIRLFPALTALENVKVGVESRLRPGSIAAMLGLPRKRREERASTDKAKELLSFVGLRDQANTLASALPYGAQRRLEIARALGTGPRTLLLDEPAAGTNLTEKRELGDLITAINRDMGIGVLLIEHDMRLVMSVADRVIVLNFGKVIATGTTAQVQRDPAVIEAYLGVTDDDAEREEAET